jgi:hypothetical protein
VKETNKPPANHEEIRRAIDANVMVNFKSQNCLQDCMSLFTISNWLQ